MTDLNLIQRIAEGEDCALAQLMQRCESAVRSRILSIVRDRTAADDLTQETFLRVWTRAGQYHGGSAEGWVGRIATNLALNHLRGNRRRPVQQLRRDDDDEDTTGDLSDLVADPGAIDPLDLVDSVELERHLRRALDELPTEKQLVHQMVVDGAELRTVAEELGIPIGTAKSRLHYTRKRLAEAWQQLARQWEDI